MKNKMIKTITITFLIIFLTGCSLSNKAYYGEYEAPDGSVIKLIDDDRCSITSDFSYSVSNYLNGVYDPIRGGHYTQVIESGRKTSSTCTYTYDESNVTLTFVVADHELTYKFEFNDENNTLTWKGYDKIYYKK